MNRQYLYYINNYTCTVFLSSREGRLRHYLGVRYDARSGVFDWDYNMKLMEVVCLTQHLYINSYTEIDPHRNRSTQK